MTLWYNYCFLNTIVDNTIMYKKILTSIAFVATIGFSQTATVSTLSMDTGLYEVSSWDVSQ